MIGLFPFCWSQARLQDLSGSVLSLGHIPDPSTCCQHIDVSSNHNNRVCGESLRHRDLQEAANSAISEETPHWQWKRSIYFLLVHINFHPPLGVPSLKLKLENSDFFMEQSLSVFISLKLSAIIACWEHFVQVARLVEWFSLIKSLFVKPCSLYSVFLPLIGHTTSVTD